MEEIMKALVYEGAKKAVLEDVKEPKKKEGAVKLDIKYCGICGSDIGIILGRIPEPRRRWFSGMNFWGLWQKTDRSSRKATG